MTFKFLRVLPRDKAGGAEVMARAESACVNPEYEQQLLFLYSSDGSRLFNLLSGFGRLFSILRNGSYSVVITSLWPVVPPMIFCRLFIPHHIRWIHFIHSDVFFHELIGFSVKSRLKWLMAFCVIPLRLENWLRELVTENPLR